MSRSRPPALEVRDLRVFHGRMEVVHGARVTVHAGEVTALLGVNGAGKTTFVSGIAGVLRSTGTVLLAGANLASARPWERTRRGLSLVQEGRRLFHQLSVLDNLHLATWGARRTKDEVGGRLEEVFALFPVLARKRSHGASTLSGGEQQMLAIGQGIMSFPQVLILDEPTAGLAPIVVGQMLEAVKELARRGFAVLLVDQSLQAARVAADRVVFMRLGQTGDALSPGQIGEEMIDAYLR